MYEPLRRPSRPSAPLRVQGHVPPWISTGAFSPPPRQLSFYCPPELAAELDRAVRITGKSRAELLAEGLRLALDSLR